MDTIRRVTITDIGSTLPIHPTGDLFPGHTGEQHAPSTRADSSRWTSVLPSLEQHLTVIRVDHRGRGDSGDAPDYSIEREFEDIASVVDSLSGPVDLLGHSYGGPCVLGATLLPNNVRMLVLYEPDALQPGDYPPSTGRIREMEAMLALVDRDGVVAAMFRDIVGVGPHELEHMGSPTGFCYDNGSNLLIGMLSDQTRLMKRSPAANRPSNSASV